MTHDDAATPDLKFGRALVSDRRISFVTAVGD